MLVYIYQTTGHYISEERKLHTRYDRIFKPGMLSMYLPAERYSFSSYYYFFFLLAVQPLVDLSLFHNCPPLFSILLFTSPVPHDRPSLDLPQLTQATST